MRLEEACGLAAAIDLELVHSEVVRLAAPRPATLFGSGTVERLGTAVTGTEATLVYVDGTLTPVQQRNLEKAWKAKVIDRTGLILEIFGERARTREGQLQVELAALTYQRSRLVRSWTHLERQRGGYGFLGGPGESQLELDRRVIGDRIVKLRGELDQVRRTRGLHRKARERVPYPVVALVGYTNAGKSTLFNRLAHAGVMAADMLFATLDPTMRAVRLPGGRTIILSDTVGFISDLPHDLVAAFSATLEEVLAADVVVHVRDIAHPQTEAQLADVESILTGLFARGHEDDGLAGRPPKIEALNKVDLLDAKSRDAIAERARRDGRAVPLSALTGEGCVALLDAIEADLAATQTVAEVEVSLSDGAELAWLYRKGEVLSREDTDEVSRVRVRLDPADLARFNRRHGGA
ncbi:MAG: GTPase HflX [Alphaproteobacteria bacterium]|nr:GTPase HflX [Alphaproteobacteria bacterium]